MKSTIQRIYNKFKYDNKIRLVLDGIGRLGLRFSPHILYLESKDYNPGYAKKNKTLFEEYEIGYSTNEDIETISSIQRPGVNRTQIQERLAEGHKCLCIRKDGQLAAFTWYNLKKAKWRKKPLDSNEAYLFDMYTLNEFRGRGLASFIRYKIYEELARIGRTRCFSYSAYYNYSSIRFKEKLNSKKSALILHFELFKIFERQYKLKDYEESERA